MDAPTKTVEMAMPAKNAEPAVEQPVCSLYVLPALLPYGP